MIKLLSALQSLIHSIYHLLHKLLYQPILCGNTISLITSSVTSVAMPDDFLYHDIQMIKFFLCLLDDFCKFLLASSFLEVANKMHEVSLC